MKASVAWLLFFGAIIVVAGARALYQPAPAAIGGPEMKRLTAALSGTWSIVQKDEPDGTSPGGAIRGEEVWHSGPGGMPLIEEYHSTSSRGESYEYAAIWWDRVARKYRGVWCAEYNRPGCTPFDVRWEGSRIVMDGEFQPRDERIAWHEVFTVTTPMSFTQTLDIGKVGGPMKRASTITATKTR